jgi:uncharacterized protein YndB with AHSA1/START domain
MTTREPLTVEQRVACPPAHAFRVWTQRFGQWWPPSHTVAGPEEVAEVVLEGRVGGRILERRHDGSEEPWGEVTAWEPPHRLSFRWHLMFPAEEATDVTVHFVPDGDGTVVRIVHGGWERLPEDVAVVRRERNRAGWGGVLPAFAETARAPED